MVNELLGEMQWRSLTIQSCTAAVANSNLLCRGFEGLVCGLNYLLPSIGDQGL